jgi:hypothetical protein
LNYEYGQLNKNTADILGVVHNLMAVPNSVAVMLEMSKLLLKNTADLE